MKEEAIARGSEAGYQVLECSELRDQVVERGSHLKAPASAAAGVGRETISRIPGDRWAKLAEAGFMLITFTIVVRKGRIS